MSGKKKPTTKTKSTYGSSVSNKKDGGTSNKSASTTTNSATATKQRQSDISSNSNNDAMPSVGYLISCDIPTKQYIQYLNELKPVDKKFILQDLDATHLLIESKAREEVERKIEDWLDENIFSAVEKVGEDFDVS